jgi:acid phosphatase
MTDDGHDTNITFASTWERNWITPLLSNSYFMDNTLILLTFDEIETYPLQNKVFAVLLGGAIPAALQGTTDDTFYTHYSAISSVSMNWGLPSLGRWDCQANVFAVVANKTGYKNQAVATNAIYLNASYPGPVSDSAFTPVWPVPDTTDKCASGQGVLASVVKAWGGQPASYNYTGLYPNVGGSAAGTAGSPGAATPSGSGTAPGPSTSAKAAASRLAGVSVAAALCAAFVIALTL